MKQSNIDIRVQVTFVTEADVLVAVTHARSEQLIVAEHAASIGEVGEILSNALDKLADGRSP